MKVPWFLTGNRLLRESLIKSLIEGWSVLVDFNNARCFSSDGSAVTVRFNLHDGSEYAFVRADRFEHLPHGILFMLGFDAVAGLGLDLSIYRNDGTEMSVHRSKLADPPFVVSEGSGP